MKKERTIETKFTSAVSLAEHLALLCKMLEAAENAATTDIDEAAETSETMAA